mgnify:CR=1 FL=1
MPERWVQFVRNSLQIVQMDSFAALFRHFSPRAQAFFAGNLCITEKFDAAGARGYLHILWSGVLRMTVEGLDDVLLTESAVILFPRPHTHGFFPAPSIGADLVCATIDLGSREGNPIGMSLPDLLVIPLAGIETLSPTLDLLLNEAFAEREGRQVALDRLFEYLLVQIIRHAVAAKLVEAGILAAFADARLARAVVALHEAPERLWTLDDLAQIAGMSRTSFACRFRELTGTTPMEHLARWRMTLAQTLLLQGKPVKSVATKVGYDSAAALTRAFGKLIGTSPRNWLADQRQANPL